MYKVRYRKFKVGTDHTTLLVGSWTVETLEAQEHYCTYRMGFTECHSEVQQYQLPEKMFQEEGRLKTCYWVLEATEKGRQNQPSSLWPGNSTPISLHTVHLRTPENDCWCYWTLLASESPNPGSVVFASMSMVATSRTLSFSFCSFLLCTDDFHHCCTNRNLNLP